MKELFFKLKPKWEEYNLKRSEAFLDGLRGTSIGQGALEDIKSKEAGYYRFLPVLVDHLKPKQIIELGGAMGASALMMLSALPKESKLYSITLPESGLEFSFVKENYPQLVPIVGDDLNIKLWPQDLNLKDTDLWFFDSEHTYDQLHSELELYKPYFKKGAIIMVDDIHLNKEMFKAWMEFPGDKFDASTWLHHSGFGLIKI